MTSIRKTKICFVSYREPFEVVLDNFSKAILLCKDNYDITLLGNDLNNSISYTDADNRNIVKLKLADNVNSNWRNFKFALKVIKFLNSSNYSIVHLDISCRYFGLIKFLTNKNKIFVFHILSYPVTNSNLSRLKIMLSTYLQSLLMDRVIIQSQEIKDRWLGFKYSKKATVIPVGFDKNKFFTIKNETKKNTKKRLNIPNDHLVLVYSGVISLHRNLEILIYSMQKISEFKKSIKLLFVGAGKAEKKLQLLAKSLHLEKSLIFTGFIPHEKVVNYIGAADIAISYVPINESYNYNPPLKTFEYLACGLPTIATQTISNKNIIEDGINGILTEDTPEDIANEVIKLIADPELGKYLSQNARKSIIEYDYESLSLKYLIPMYEELLTKQ